MQEQQGFHSQGLNLHPYKKITLFLIPLCGTYVNNKYDLSINRYKEIVYQEEEYDPPKEILARMKELEEEIMKDMAELEGMLG